MTSLSDFSHKTVSFRYDGTELLISLSHGLFSSFAIDAGSKLLLKCVREHVDFSSVKNVLDTGCGTGVLGLAVKAAHPEINLYFEDRDALAVEFARENARKNGLDLAGAETGLAFSSFRETLSDLVLFNIPAKAGDPVLKAMAFSSLARLSAKGRVGLVIVNTLASRWDQIMKETLAQVLVREEGPEHTVFIYGGSGEPSPHGTVSDAGLPSAYFRQKGIFEDVQLDTVYGLPGFETPSFAERQHLSVFDRLEDPEEILVIGPGQGWVSVFAAKKFPGSKITLMDRDSLALAVSSLNTSKYIDSVETKIRAHVALTGPGPKYKAVFYTHETIPMTDLDSGVWSALCDLCAPGGILSLCAGSGEYTALLRKRSGFVPIREGHKKNLRHGLFRKT